jgi:hypothetical protein
MDTPYIRCFLQHASAHLYTCFTTTTYKTQHFSKIQGKQTRRKRNHIRTSQQTHTTSIQDREEPQRNTSVEELHTTATTR